MTLTTEKRYNLILGDADGWSNEPLFSEQDIVDYVLKMNESEDEPLVAPITFKEACDDLVAHNYTIIDMDMQD